MVEREAPAARLFSPGRLTLGVVLPLRRAEGVAVDFGEQLALAARADALGFDALWVRDVPLNGAWYPESFGHPDPLVMLGALAARTAQAVLGTAAIVLPLRHPLHVAKAALSLDALTGGRFLLGLGSGDRPEEYAAFGRSGEERRELYRRHWDSVSAAVGTPQRIVLADGSIPAERFELRPAPTGRLAMLAVGSGGQPLEWIARNAVGWATYHRPPEVQRDRHALWRRAVEHVAPDAFRSFSVATRIDLLADPRAPAEPIELGYRAGSAAFGDVLEAMRDAGVHHVLLNLVPGGRPPEDVLREIAATILPRLR